MKCGACRSTALLHIPWCEESCRRRCSEFSDGRLQRKRRIPAATLLPPTKTRCRPHLRIGAAVVGGHAGSATGHNGPLVLAIVVAAQGNHPVRTCHRAVAGGATQVRNQGRERWAVGRGAPEGLVAEAWHCECCSWAVKKRKERESEARHRTYRRQTECPRAGTGQGSQNPQQARRGESGPARWHAGCRAGAAGRQERGMRNTRPWEARAQWRRPGRQRE